MTFDTIRQKVRDHHAKTRRQVAGNVLASVIAAGLYGLGISRFDRPLLQILFAAGIIWSLASLYFHNRGMWSAMLTEDAGLRTGLESYRREVERRRALFARFLLWAFGPGVFGVLTVIVVLLTLAQTGGTLATAALFKMSPFLTMVIIWLAGVFVLRTREHRLLRRELTELQEIERR